MPEPPNGGDSPPSTEVSIDGDEKQETGKHPLLKHTQTRLALGDGKVVDVHDLGIPAELKDIIEKLDFDGSGEVSHEEIMESLELLKVVKGQIPEGQDPEETHDSLKTLERLMTARKENHDKMEYGHMPDKIKSILTNWDEEKRGFIDGRDLMHASECMEKISKQNRLMRILIVGLVIVIAILLAGMFATSMAAAELAKEMKAGESGIMTTPNGDVVKMENPQFTVNADGTLASRSKPLSCPAGNNSCARRLAEDGGTALKTSAHSEVAGLISTLPDTAFQELKTLQFKHGENTMQLMILNFERVRTRTSKCGSVVHLHSDRGRLTIDDVDVTVDQALADHMDSAGFGHVFAERRLAGFGHRQLKETDGMLSGFFNSLEGANYECSSQPLAAPEDLEAGFFATVAVKQMAEVREDMMSEILFLENGKALPLPGVTVDEKGEVFQHWKEQILNMDNGVEAYLSTYATYPFLKVLRIKQGKAELRMVVERGIGHQCELYGNEEVEKVDNEEEEDDSNMRLEFVGVEDVKGLLVRHFRMSFLAEMVEFKRRRRLRRRLSNSSTDSDDLKLDPEMLMQSGMAPTHMDYWDVDTDPNGIYEAGDTYKLSSYSTVKGVRMYDEKTYLSVEPHPEVLDLAGVFAKFGVGKLGQECRWAGQKNNDVIALIDAAHALPDANVESKPNNMDVPFAETSGLKEMFQRLVAVNVAQLDGEDLDTEDKEALELAKDTEYWSFALLDGKEEMEDAFQSLAVEQVDVTRRLAARRLSDNSSTSAALEAVRRDLKEERDTRQLLSNRSGSRRLGMAKVSSSTWIDGGNRQHEIHVEIKDDVEIGFVWTKEMATGDLVMLRGQGTGCVTVWRPPKVSACGGGSIEFYPGNPPEIGGSIIVGVKVKVCGIGPELELEVGGAIWFPRKKHGNSGYPGVAISNVWGMFTIAFEVGKITASLGAKIIMEPGRGCSQWCNDYYKKWKLTLQVYGGIKWRKKEWVLTKTILEKDIR